MTIYKGGNQSLCRTLRRGKKSVAGGEVEVQETNGLCILKSLLFKTLSPSCSLLIFSPMGSGLIDVGGGDFLLHR